MKLELELRDDGGILAQLLMGVSERLKCAVLGFVESMLKVKYRTDNFS